MRRKRNNILTYSFIVGALFFQFSPANAVKNDMCPREFKPYYDVKISTPPDAYGAHYVNTQILPKVSGDIQAVWRVSLQEGSSFEKAIEEHIENFYSNNDKAENMKLKSHILAGLNKISEIRKMVIDYEYSELTTESVIKNIKDTKWIKQDENIKIDKVLRYLTNQIKKYSYISDKNIALMSAYAGTMNEVNRLRGVAPRLIYHSGMCWEFSVYSFENCIRRTELLSRYPPLNSYQKSNLAELYKNTERKFYEKSKDKSPYEIGILINNGMYRFERGFENITYLDYAHFQLFEQDKFDWNMWDYQVLRRRALDALKSK